MKWYYMILLLTVLGLSSCSKMDDYKNFIGGETLSYSGKADSLKVFSGKDRVKLQWLITTDPNVNKTIIYWKNRADSVVINYTRKQGIDTISKILENLPEGNYSFELVNYDKLGNKSVSQYAVGNSYGALYQKGLLPRALINTTLINFEGNVQMIFADSILTALGVEIIYTNKLNEEVNVSLANKDLDITLLKCDLSKPILYRSLYKPNPKAIDTFYTEFDQFKFEDDMFLELPKPYKSLILTGDAPAELVPNSWNKLWDGKVQKTWQGYGEVSYSNFSTVGPVGTDIWVSMDINSIQRLSRIRADFYYYKEGSGPKIMDVLAYVGVGTPPSLPLTDPNYWKDWVTITTFNTTDYPFSDSNVAISQPGFSRGLDASFEKSNMNVPAARYYRLKCRAAWTPWNQASKNFSLSEITFWAYVN